MMDGFITVDMHHRGVFVLDPVRFNDAEVVKVSDVNFGRMDFESFHLYLKKLLRDPCHYIYFCIPKLTLTLGLRKIKNDADFQQFLKHAYDSGKISVYVDTFCQDMTPYLVEDVQIYNSSDEDDALSNDVSVDHEEDEEVIKFKSKVDDDFSTELVLDTEHGHVRSSSEQEGSTYPTHDPTLPWNKMEPVVGMKFVDCKELKECLTNYAVANGYALYYEKTTQDKLLVKCGDRNSKDKCTFRLWATWMSNQEAFQIKTLVPDHSCSRNYSLGSLVTFSWIANKYAKKLIANPGMSIRALQQDVKEKYNIKVSVSQCQRAKKEALGEIESKLIAHYGLLWSYAEELRRANPGSTIKLEVNSQPDGKNYFKRFYICLKELKEGWISGCRKVIGVDGAFLKGICRWELITAVGRDSNNQLYPLAWAVVSVENTDSWRWFLELLEEDIGMSKGCGLTLLSDGHKGLSEALKDIMPKAEHRLCGRHIYANLAKRFKGPNYKKLYWRAAKATTQIRFERCMQSLKEFNVHAYTYLMEREPKCWSRAFFQVGRQCDACENGVCESFNAAVADARRKPVVIMLEEIRLYVMERITTKFNKGSRWKNPICPKIKKKFDKVKKKSRFWEVIASGFHKFETRRGDDAFCVDLNDNTCTCRSWQLKGIPCVHTCAALSHLNKKPDTLISPCFTKDVYLRTYSHNINPLNGKDMWPLTSYFPPLPPKVRRMPGRPSIKRKRGEHEREEQALKHSVSKKGAIMTCSLCKARGHNKSTCPSVKKTKSKSKEQVGQQSKSTKGKISNEQDPDTTNTINPEGKRTVEQQTKKFKKQRLPVLLQDSEETVIPENREEQPPKKTRKQRLPVLLQESEETVVVGEDLHDVVVGEEGMTETDEVNEGGEEADVGVQGRRNSAANLVRTRKPSERIAKLKIRRSVYDADGGGSSISKPVDLE